MQRRAFIKKAGIATAGLALGAPIGTALASIKAVAPPATVGKSLFVLHTNDVHSRLDPFPMDGGKHQGKGGVSARKRLIDSFREMNYEILLLDAGDMFQGTPYFNLYNGEPEIKAMSMMGYDACTMGNHDFDAGIDNFARQLQHANFDVVVCNYDFTNTSLEDKVKPYTIIRKGGLKIGIIGVGIELKGLVPEALYGETKYKDPIAPVNHYAQVLKDRKNCDLVICLSHLGYEYTGSKIDDKKLAKATSNIDLIIGGHTHTFLDKPYVAKNADNKEVLINQVGFGGVQLGLLQFDFIHKNETKKTHQSNTVIDVK